MFNLHMAFYSHSLTDNYLKLKLFLFFLNKQPVITHFYQLYICCHLSLVLWEPFGISFGTIQSPWQHLKWITECWTPAERRLMNNTWWESGSSSRFGKEFIIWQLQAHLPHQIFCMSSYTCHELLILRRHHSQHLILNLPSSHTFQTPTTSRIN